MYETGASIQILLFMKHVGGFSNASKVFRCHLADAVLNSAGCFRDSTLFVAHGQTEKYERNQSKGNHALKNLITNLKPSSFYQFSRIASSVV